MAKSKHPKQPSDYTDDQIRDAIIAGGGYIRGIAEKLGVNSESLRYRINQNPELRETMFEVQEQVTDKAELYLIEAIDSRKPWAIKLWLSRKGRNRGWGQTLEVQGKIDSGGSVVVYLPDDGRESKPDGDNGDSTAAGAAGHSTPQ